jgi:hypothetical protein
MKVHIMPTDTPLKVVRRRHSINGLRVIQPPNIPAPSGTEGDLPPDAESHRVKEFSEKWRHKAEELLRTCPSKEDLAYIQHFLARLEVQKFQTDSQVLLKMRTSKAQRAEQAGKRRMRR